jgi:flagellar hook protein FlgE
MSINDAMLAGVTGLIANSTALSAISDNIANSQTVGYKTTKVDFSTLVTGQSTAGAISAGGVTAVTSQDVVHQGQLQTTTSPTDLAIQGTGFFVTTQSASSPTSTTPVLFTRAGSFTQNSQGYLVNSAGLYLQGWPVNANGQIQSDPTNLTKLSPINVTAIAGAAEPTTTLTLSANVQASQVTSQAAQDASLNPTAADAYSSGNANSSGASTSMAAYDPTTGTGGTAPDITMQLPVSDSKGTQQTLQLDLLKSNTPNQWYAEIVANPANSVATPAGVPPGQVAAGIIAFTPTGQYDAKTTASLNPAGSLFSTNPPVLQILDSATTPGAGQVGWASKLGDASQNITLNFDGTLTQFDSPTAVQQIQANGTTFGNLSSIEVGSDGAVTAVFDNGVTRQIAQIALATVPNPDGMTAQAGNAYTISNQSGTATLKTPGTGGAGTVVASSLEASTVDLSTEFTSLIQTQQAYSAASKIITTANQMITTLEDVIR